MSVPEFTIERTISAEETIGLVRNTQMMVANSDGGFTKPYEDADITIETIEGDEYDELWKTSLYIARDTLSTQQRLKDAIALEGFHPAELLGGLVINSFKDGEPIQTNFIPPLVEVSEQFGTVLMDGSHRDYGRRVLEGKNSLNIIRVAGVTLPSYAWPNRRDALKVYDTAPTDAHGKKWYVNLDPDGGDVTRVINPRTGRPFEAGEEIPQVIDPRTGEKAIVAQLYRALPNGSRPRNTLPGQQLL